MNTAGSLLPEIDRVIEPAPTHQRGILSSPTAFPPGIRTTNLASSSIGAFTRVPAFGNEWYPRNMYLPGHAGVRASCKTYGPHQHSATRISSPMSTAEKFDPAQWADLFRQAGAKFVVRSPSTMTASPCTTAPSRAGPPRKWGPSAISSASWPRLCATGHGLRPLQPPRRALVVHERRA